MRHLTPTELKLPSELFFAYRYCSLVNISTEVIGNTTTLSFSNALGGMDNPLKLEASSAQLTKVKMQRILICEHKRKVNLTSLITYILIKFLYQLTAEITHVCSPKLKT